MTTPNLTLDGARSALTSPGVRARLGWLLPGLIPADPQLGGEGAVADDRMLESIARVLSLRRDYADVFIKALPTLPEMLDPAEAPSAIADSEPYAVVATVISAAYLSLPELVEWHGYAGQVAIEVQHDFEPLMQLTGQVLERPGPCLFPPFD